MLFYCHSIAWIILIIFTSIKLNVTWNRTWTYLSSGICDAPFPNVFPYGTDCDQSHSSHEGQRWFGDATAFQQRFLQGHRTSQSHMNSRENVRLAGEKGTKVINMEINQKQSAPFNKLTLFIFKGGAQAPSVTEFNEELEQSKALPLFMDTPQ